VGHRYLLIELPIKIISICAVKNSENEIKIVVNAKIYFNSENLSVVVNPICILRIAVLENKIKIKCISIRDDDYNII